MADRIFYIYGTADGAPIPMVAHDNGDGTFSLTISGGGGGGPVTEADGANVVLGSLADAANTTGATGTISGKLRGLVTLMVNLLSRWIPAIGPLVKANSVSVTRATDEGPWSVSGTVATTTADGANVAQGATTDTAVTTDANGTLSAKLRGLVVLMVNLLSRWPAALGQQTRAGSLSVTQASDATGANAPQMQGTAAAGAAVAGNPNLMGGSDGTNVRAIATETNGIQKMVLYSSGGSVIFLNATQDALASSVASILASSIGMAYNGSTLDRIYNNREATVLASAARTASTNSSDQTNYNARGIVVTIDVTAVAGSPSLTFAITGKSTLAGAYRAILTSAAITGISRTILKVYPGLTAAANLTANDILERLWRIEVTAGTADSVTYSVSANYI